MRVWNDRETTTLEDEGDVSVVVPLFKYGELHYSTARYLSNLTCALCRMSFIVTFKNEIAISFFRWLCSALLLVHSASGFSQTAHTFDIWTPNGFEPHDDDALSSQIEPHRMCVCEHYFAATYVSTLMRKSTEIAIEFIRFFAAKLL